MRKLIVIGSLLLSLFLFACDKNQVTHQHSSLYFGTLIDVSIYGVSEQKAALAFDQLDQDFAHFHSVWSPWEPGALKRANSLFATGKPFSLGPSVFPLIEESIDLSNKTNGLFNPAINQLISLWQFHRHDDPEIKPPDDKLIQALVKANPNMNDLIIEGIKISSKNPEVALNFGAFAKGYAIDLEIQQLKNMGIEHAIVNTGGDLKAIGQHGTRPWKIAIQHPRKDTWLASIETQGDESIFTSGDYQRYYMHKGKRYHHILDPRTGYPAQGAQSVTVIHQDAGLADAAATALFVAGPEEWLSIARNLDLKQAMLVDDKGQIHITPEMRTRITFNPEIEAIISVTAPL